MQTLAIALRQLTEKDGAPLPGALSHSVPPLRLLNASVEEADSEPIRLPDPKEWGGEDRA